MDKIIFGKTGLKVSRIAFGGIPIMRLSKEEASAVVRKSIDLGINFIDTANGYTDSEEKIGAAIKGIPRENLVIASKSPANDKKTFLEHVDLSLKRMNIEYLDIYQLHGVSSDKTYDAVFGENGAMEGLELAVKQGKVRFQGFSSHTMRTAAKIISTGRFYSMQIPFNFIDTEALDEVIPAARNQNMGIIAMKPLGGGLLNNAGLCFRYLLQFDGIIPDPGIEKFEEMKEIVEIVKNLKPLTDQEKKEIKNLKTELGDEWCHRCDYCQPCPANIRISTVLVIKAFIKRMPFERAEKMLSGPIEDSLNCTECRECVKKCPYNLDIPRLLKQNKNHWDNFKKSYAG